VGTDIPLYGITIFDSPRFLDCELANITLMMNRASYDAIDSEEFRKHIPVING
jgi:hypothetical protein